MRPPTVDELATALAEDALDLSGLSPLMLVGNPGAPDEDGWSYATQEMELPAEGSPPSREPASRALGDALVLNVEKRTGMFPDVILVGRSSSNDVVVDQETVSKLHARIRLDDGRFRLLDAGSANGTWVNEVRIRKEVRVGRSDVVHFGSVRFRVYDLPALLVLLARPYLWRG